MLAWKFNIFFGQLLSRMTEEAELLEDMFHNGKDEVKREDYIGALESLLRVQSVYRCF